MGDMLDGFGTLAIGGAIGTVFAAVVGTGLTSLRSRLVFGAVVAAWIGLAVGVTGTGKLLNPLVLLALFALPILTVALLSGMPRARAILFGFPVPLIVGLNVLRVLGFFFLLLATVGRLSGPFPYFAGLGDIVTGLFAIPVSRLVARGLIGDPRVAAWNCFGALDLVVAVTLGLTSRSGSPLQLIHAGVGSAAITTLPWSLIPLVLVPTFLIGHALVFAHLHAHASSRLSLDQRAANA
jgi:hypothetical protein